jgi:hypothetical protein
MLIQGKLYFNNSKVIRRGIYIIILKGTYAEIALRNFYVERRSVWLWRQTRYASILGLFKL